MCPECTICPRRCTAWHVDWRLGLISFRGCLPFQSHPLVQRRGLGQDELVVCVRACRSQTFSGLKFDGIFSWPYFGLFFCHTARKFPFLWCLAVWRYSYLGGSQPSPLILVALQFLELGCPFHPEVGHSLSIRKRRAVWYQDRRGLAQAKHLESINIFPFLSHLCALAPASRRPRQCSRHRPSAHRADGVGTWDTGLCRGPMLYGF